MDEDDGDYRPAHQHNNQSDEDEDDDYNQQDNN